MVVHLIDGTYELFRHFYGRRSGGRSDAQPLGAVLALDVGLNRLANLWTLFRIVDATSARFRPYSTTTWRSIVTPSPLRPISIPRVGRSGSHFRPAIATTP